MNYENGYLTCQIFNFDSDLPTDKNSIPFFLAEAKQINDLLREKSPVELSELLKISDKLGGLNWERNQNFTTPFNPDNARPAIYAFDGDVYSGLMYIPFQRIKLALCKTVLGFSQDYMVF